MDIVRLIKDAHQNAIDKGFYDCPICVDPETNEPIGCGNCDNTGKDHNKNIGELLMLIVSELGEALEAHRKGRFANPSSLVNVSDYPDKKQEAIYLFESGIKDTFEDEIADVFIRLFDLCGYLGIDTKEEEVSYFDNKIDKNVASQLFDISSNITDYIKSVEINIVVWRAFFQLKSLCKFHNIPIEKHIEAKMAYNRTREHKHGKAY